MADGGGFFGGLGGFLGGLIGSGMLGNAMSGIENIAGNIGPWQNNIQPWVNVGKGALGSWASGLGIGPHATPNELGKLWEGGDNPFDVNTIGKSFQASPGYQWQVGQAESANNLSAGARGGLLSGNTMQAGQGIASQLANQNYWQYITGQQSGISNWLNALQGISGQMGQISGQGLSAGQSQLSAQAQVDAAEMQAQAALAAAQAQSASSGIGSLFSGLGGLFGMI
jgi:hypothetical protein